MAKTKAHLKVEIERLEGEIAGMLKGIDNLKDHIVREQNYSKELCCELDDSKKGNKILGRKLAELTVELAKAKGEA